jgi:hypothetical protein
MNLKEKDEKREEKCFTNILYKCKNCKMIISTEQNISKLEEEYLNIVNYYKFCKNKEIIFTVQKSKNNDEINQHLLFEFSENKVLCKLCKFEIGTNYKPSSNKKIHKESVYIGTLLMDRIIPEEITFKQLDPKKKIPVKSKIVSENLTNFKKIKLTNSIITGWCKDYYVKELTQAEEKLISLEEKADLILEKNEEYINILNLLEEK